MFILLCLAVLLLSDQCNSNEEDLGFSLNVGHAIDVFANFGDLSQVTQVISDAYEMLDPMALYEDDYSEVFNEKNLRVFENATSKQYNNDTTFNMTIKLCETFDDLMDAYYENFKIEGITKPWKAFMGDWMHTDIFRTFGLPYDNNTDFCCYVLVRLRKYHQTVKLDDLKYFAVKDYMQRAINDLNTHDPAAIKEFMTSYGSHYIDSYATGNFIYQVFKYKKESFKFIKVYLRDLRSQRTSADNLRFYLSSYFLEHVGDIRTASGNRSIEYWLKDKLADSQYLYTRGTILKFRYNTYLARKLHAELKPAALLGLELKSLKPLFKDPEKSYRYKEVVENSGLLWEINS